MNRRKRVAIFVSGSGTNMENIAKRAQSGELNCDIALVVCDNPKAFALIRAKKLGLNTFVIERKNYLSKSEFEAQIDKKLGETGIEAIFLAGYMRILGPEFVRKWAGKILNIHPSLLPKFPGTCAIKDAFEAKENRTGVTVHFVDEGVDSGPVILQRPVSIQANDTFDTLEARVHETEYQIYPEAIQLFLEGKITLQNNKVKIQK